jgi:hypothetical protein
MSYGYLKWKKQLKSFCLDNDINCNKIITYSVHLQFKDQKSDNLLREYIIGSAQAQDLQLFWRLDSF